MPGTSSQHPGSSTHQPHGCHPRLAQGHPARRQWAGGTAAGGCALRGVGRGRRGGGGSGKGDESCRRSQISIIPPAGKFKSAPSLHPKCDCVRRPASEGTYLSQQPALLVSASSLCTCQHQARPSVHAEHRACFERRGSSKLRLKDSGRGGGGGRTPGEEQPLALPARLLCQWAWLNSCHPSLHFPSPILPCSAPGRPGSSEILLGYEPPATGALRQLQTLLQTPRSLLCRAAYGPGI